MPAPVPDPQDRDASPRLWDSSILPSAPVGLVPGPSVGSGSTTSSWTRAPALGTTKETLPVGTEVRSTPSVAIIGAWLIIESPASVTRTVTVDPGRRGAEHEMAPEAPELEVGPRSATRSMSVTDPTTRPTAAMTDATISPRWAGRPLNRSPGSGRVGACTHPRRSPHVPDARRGCATRPRCARRSVARGEWLDHLAGAPGSR